MNYKNGQNICLSELNIVILRNPNMILKPTK